ncbi:hypothetical protein FNYG_14828 [Fusarium nygamai]|uniref:Uncharacterized protein n=1 Tax=Gibberella nygamai TaxID=42673 RepID=A0A2K0UQ20_GIBNY|nr:hypothetical protein FNYG_14828 [Fusarium nygamai]
MESVDQDFASSVVQPTAARFAGSHVERRSRSLPLVSVGCLLQRAAAGTARMLSRLLFGSSSITCGLKDIVLYDFSDPVLRTKVTYKTARDASGPTHLT